MLAFKVSEWHLFQNLAKHKMQDYNEKMTVADQPLTSPRSLGFRVKAARTAKGWKQEELSKAMGIADRQTISTIENGERSLKPEELVQLCALLERDIEYFIDPFVVDGEAMFSWRASDSLPNEELSSFESKAGPWIGMLRFLRRLDTQVGGPFGMTLRLNQQSSFEDALAMGESVAEFMSLGSVPSERLVEKIESDLDIPVLFVDSIQSPQGVVSGATCHLPDLGVILINRNETEARRNYDLAHELFHALTWTIMPPDHRESLDTKANGKQWRVEKLADSFAAGLLMPTASLKKVIDSRLLGDKSHLVDVADQLRVSPTALAYRLFNAKLIDQYMCQALHGEKSRLPLIRPKRFSSSFVELVYQGIEQGQVSARKVAKTLDLNLHELKDLFAEHFTKPAPFTL